MNGSQGTEAAGVVSRRNALTAAAAMAGALLAKLAGADRAHAGHSTDIAYDTQTVVHTDVTNTTAGSTRISSDISGTAAFVGLNDYPVGISRPDGILGRTSYTTSNAAGVAGSCEAASGGIGVLGTANNATGVGVFGNAGSNVPSEAPPQGSGVYGVGGNRGLSGRSTAGIGVYGFAGAAAADLGGTVNTGVFGRSIGGAGVHGASTSGYGVRGVTAGDVAAVRGEGIDTGVGVEGIGGAGVRGTSAAGATAVGVEGITAAGTGVRGVATGPGVAGRFEGKTVVEGVFETVGQPLAAVVASQRTYAAAALSPVFEHFGEAKLKRGKARIKLPAAFDQLVTGTNYQVFLTEYGDYGGLFVALRTEHQFNVRARRGRANGKFGYRVVAVRPDLKN